MSSAECELPIWVIYERPSDHPQGFIARKWLLDQPTEEVVVGDTLESIRAKLPAGLACLARDPLDDPKIVESWL